MGEFFAAKEGDSLLSFTSVVGRINGKSIWRALAVNWIKRRRRERKTADRKTTIDYHARGQMGKTIINYQKDENDVFFIKRHRHNRKNENRSAPIRSGTLDL